MKFWQVAIVMLLLPFICMASTIRHTGPAYDRNARIALDKVIDRLSKKYNFQLLNSSTGSMIDADCAHWGISWMVRYPMTLEQARPIAADLVRTLLREIYCNPLYTTAHRAIRPRSPPELSETMVAFKVAFWNSSMDRPLFPSLAQFRYAEGRIYYYYADPQTQGLQMPTVETLTDMNIVPTDYKPPS